MVASPRRDAQDRHDQQSSGWVVRRLLLCRRADVPTCRRADVPTAPLPETGRETGIDVGLQVVLITAEGARVANPRHSRTAEKALAKAQQRVSRRKKGRTRRKKAVQLLAKQHQHVRRQRADFHHKTALALVRPYDTLAVAAIQPANLSRRPAPVSDGNGG